MNPVLALQRPLARCLALVALTLGAIAPASAHPQSRPYELQAVVLWGAEDEETEFQLTITSRRPAFLPPDVVEKIVIRGPAFEGGPIIRRQFRNVPFAVSGNQSTASVRLSGINADRQEFDVTVRFKGGRHDRRTFVLRDSSPLTLRPDWVIRDLLVPDPIVAGQPAEFVAILGEDTLEYGATGDVSLYYLDLSLPFDPDNFVLFGRATGLAVEPGGTIVVPITGTFSAPGQYVFEVRIENTAPEEFDLGNNVGNTEVEVLAP